MHLKIIAVFYLVFSVLSTSAFSQTIGIGVGQKGGTYYKMAEDIQKLAKCSKSGLNIDIVETDGSLSILNQLSYNKSVQIGLVQADVLYYINSKDDPSLKVYEKKIRMIFPLHHNEVHVLAKTDITKFEELHNRKVAVGPNGSGTYLTSTLLFKYADIKPSEQLNLDTKEALKKLKSGEIDAMIYVAGQPVPLFNDLDEGDKLHFLPITEEKITQLFSVGSIKKSSYSKLMDSDVQSVLVKNVLMSFDFQQDNCKNIRKLSKIIKDNISWLKTNGHEKWNEVDLNDGSVKKWPIYACVLDKIDDEKSYSCEGKPEPCTGNQCNPEAACEKCKNMKDPLQRSLCELKCGE